MTPVAGRVANGNKEQAVGALGQLEGFGTPELPGCRVVGVRSDVWRLAFIAAVAERYEAAFGRSSAHGSDS